MLSDKGTDVHKLFNSVQPQDSWILDELGWDCVQTALTGGISNSLASEPQPGPSTTQDPCGYSGNRLFCYILFSVMLLRIEMPLPLLRLILLGSRFCKSCKKPGDTFESWVTVIEWTRRGFVLWISSGTCRYDGDVHPNVSERVNQRKYFLAVSILTQFKLQMFKINSIFGKRICY